MGGMGPDRPQPRRAPPSHVSRPTPRHPWPWLIAGMTHAPAPMPALSIGVLSRARMASNVTLADQHQDLHSR
jgi:hypothetical protein